MNSVLNFLIGPFGVLVCILAIFSLITGMLAPFLAGAATVPTETPGAAATTTTTTTTRSAAAIHLILAWRLPLALAMIAIVVLRVFRLS